MIQMDATMTARYFWILSKTKRRDNVSSIIENGNSEENGRVEGISAASKAGIRITTF